MELLHGSCGIAPHGFTALESRRPIRTTLRRRAHPGAAPRKVRSRRWRPDTAFGKKRRMIVLLLVAVALATAPTAGAAAPWRVEVATHGGLSGRGAGAVKVRSNGDLEVVTPEGKRCEVRLERAALAKVEQSVQRARPERWRPRYFLPDNPTGCCDQVSTTLAVIRGQQGAEKQSVTGWYDESRQLAARDALGLYEAAMDLALAHQGCVAKAY